MIGFMVIQVGKIYALCVILPCPNRRNLQSLIILTTMISQETILTHFWTPHTSQVNMHRYMVMDLSLLKLKITNATETCLSKRMS